MHNFQTISFQNSFTHAVFIIDQAATWSAWPVMRFEVLKMGQNIDANKGLSQACIYLYIIYIIYCVHLFGDRHWLQDLGMLG